MYRALTFGQSTISNFVLNTPEIVYLFFSLDNDGFYQQKLAVISSGEA